MIGLDTGYFVRLLQGEQGCRGLWESLVNGEEEAAISCLTLFELERLGLKGVIGEPEQVLESIQAVCAVVWMNGPSVLSLGARLSHGAGLPAMDALILACLLSAGADAIYTTDADFDRFRKDGVEIVRIP